MRPYARSVSFLNRPCRISLDDQRSVIQAYENSSDRNALCEASPSVDENNVKSIVRRYCRFWRERLLSERISLSGITALISGCFAHYSLQFMQIHRMANTLFVHTPQPYPTGLPSLCMMEKTARFNFDNGSAYKNRQMELLAARIGSTINYFRLYTPTQKD